MPTQIYLGEELEAREATQEEQATIMEIQSFLAEERQRYQKLEELYNSLPKNVALVGSYFNTEKEEMETRTHIVGKPKGQYIYAKEVDFLMNAKTTKKLLKELNKD